MSRVYRVRQDAVATPQAVTIDPAFEQVEVHLEYYDSTDYDVLATPGAGTATVVGTRPDGKTVAFVGSALDCTDVNALASMVGNFSTVTVTPSGITTAVSYIVVVTVTDLG